MTKQAQILIGNLSTDAKEEQICEIFSKTTGKLKSLSIPKDPRTEKGKGFAFVEMYSILEAIEAISSLKGECINGRKLSMSLVEPKKEERKWYQLRWPITDTTTGDRETGGAPDERRIPIK